jgi:hypothetical protein
MVSGEVASKLDSRGPFQGESYSNSECNLPKVEVASSNLVSRFPPSAADTEDLSLRRLTVLARWN